MAIQLNPTLTVITRAALEFDGITRIVQLPSQTGRFLVIYGVNLGSASNVARIIELDANGTLVMVSGSDTVWNTGRVVDAFGITWVSSSGGSDKFIIAWRGEDNGGPIAGNAAVLTVTGAVINRAAGTAGDFGNLLGGVHSITRVANDKAIIGYTNGSNKHSVRAILASGSTAILGSETVLTIGATTEFCVVAGVDDNKAIIIYQIDALDDFLAVVATISGTAVTDYTPIVIETDTAAENFTIEAISTALAYMTRFSGGDILGSQLTITGNDLVLGGDSIVSPNGDGFANDNFNSGNGVIGVFNSVLLSFSAPSAGSPFVINIFSFTSGGVPTVDETLFGNVETTSRPQHSPSHITELGVIAYVTDDDPTLVVARSVGTPPALSTIWDIQESLAGIPGRDKVA